MGGLSIKLPPLNARAARISSTWVVLTAVALLVVSCLLMASHIQGLTGHGAFLTHANTRLDILLFFCSALLLAAALWARRRIAQDISARLYCLERFTRAFGRSRGTLRGLDGRILFWDGAQRQFGYTPEEALGKISRELLQQNFSQPFQEIEALLLKNGEWQGQFTCRHKDGRELHMIGDWTLSRGEAGAPDMVVEISTDITAMKIAEQDRERAHALMRTVVETTPGLIYAKDREGRMIMANAAALKLIGKPWPLVAGRTDQDFLDDKAQGAKIAANDQRIMEQCAVEEIEEEVGNAAGELRIFSSIKMPLFDPAARVVGLIGLSFDVTERKRTENRLRLMVNELNHRVKNTLATVQAIAAQTLRSTDPLLQQKLEDRLMALAAAHDVLTRESWEGAALENVVADSLASFGGYHSGRFSVKGPPLRLAPRAALALAMGLHELGTNALKYGALTTLAGGVEIIWEIAPAAEPLFRLIWTEVDGPPVTAPFKYGYGVRLIERSLAQTLGGVAKLRFDAEGVRCFVEVPLSEVVAPTGEVKLISVGDAP